MAFYGYVEDINTFIDAFGLAKHYGKDFVMTSKDKTNKREGARREATMKRILEGIYGEGNVLSERILYDGNGNKVTSGGSGRRIDFVVTDGNGNAIKSIEVTSKTANKVPQQTKENLIRGKGGTFIKDANGNLIDVKNVKTDIIRLK